MNNFFRIIKKSAAFAAVLFIAGCQPFKADSQDLSKWYDSGILSDYFGLYYPSGAKIMFRAESGRDIVCGVAELKDARPESWNEFLILPQGEKQLWLHVKEVAGNGDEVFSRAIVVTDDLKESKREYIDYKDNRIKQWCAEVVEYKPGIEVSQFMDTAKALGAAKADVYDVLSLGSGGSVTVKFAEPVSDQLGADICVFENGLSGVIDGQARIFAELAFVEVSSNGTDFVRFPSFCLDSTEKSEFEKIYEGNYHGLAGIAELGDGVLFDLADLVCTEAVVSGDVNLSEIKYVRIIDIAGVADKAHELASFDSFGNLITDPYLTHLSGGFDLDGVGALNAGK